MGSARSAIRSGLIICIAGVIALAASFVATAEDGDFPLAFVTLGTVQTGSDVQTASGVIKTLHRLALEEGYTDEQADALIGAVAGLIASKIPPGTILQVSKQLLEDTTPGELLTTLEELGQRIADGEPPGQVANNILERGNGNKDGEPPGQVANNNLGHGNGKKDGEKDESLDDEDEDLDDEDEDLDDKEEEDDNNGNGKGKGKGKGKKK